jgi:Ca2+-transporting ATPase
VEKEDEKGLSFAGLIVFSDPIRASASRAIAECQSANIQIKMLTGDHPLTAHAVANQTGILHDHAHLYTGDQIAKMSRDERWRAYRDGAIFSRVLPEQKYEMVQALKDRGLVVAMTGDGINDAPALKLADIGISMGANATDVARSAARMILTRNDFQGIVEAVFQGRKIFSNLKRSFSYLVSFHVPVIFLALLPPILGWGDLLLPIHIVLLELIVHPVSAFTFENMEADGKSREKGLMTGRRFFEAALSGILLSVGTLALFRLSQSSLEIDSARAVAMTTVLLGNVFFVIVESWPNVTRRLVITSASILGLSLLLNGVREAGALFHLGAITANQFFLAGGIGVAASIPTFFSRFLLSRSKRRPG